MTIVEGRVAAVITRRDSYHILAFDPLDPASRNMKAAGHLHGLLQVRPGVPLRLSGDWVEHPKYGRQLAITGWSPWAETSADVSKFLHECIEGFADIDLAQLIANTFGPEAYDILTDQPDKARALAEPGTPRWSALDRAVQGWAVSQSTSGLASLFRDFAINQELVRSAFREFGPNAVDIIAKNPYRLLVIEGFTFTHADRLADRLGVPQNDIRRVEGAVLWLLRSEARNGHLCVRKEVLDLSFLETIPRNIQETFGSPSTLTERLLAAVDSLASTQAVIVDPGNRVYLPSLYHYERDSAAKLASLMKPSKIELDLDAFLLEYEKGQRIELSDAQKDAVRQLVEHRVLVLTGLPGTGKTTVVKAFVRLFQAASMSYLLMAPTGIAAKRLGAVVGTDASTIHRALKCDGRVWHHNNLSRYTVDAVIIDEMSMVDQELFFRALDALHPGTMLVLVGDDAQLPSVGPGNVLRELVSCPHISHVRLTQIFRQTERSEIVVASHKIQRGSSPLTLDQKPTSEFYFKFVTDEEAIAAGIVEIAAKLKDRDANFQVLSPKYDGKVGVDRLNELLRERLNPDRGQREWLDGKLHIRVGDRLIILQNDYQLNIYNGDMCKLVGVDRDTLSVRIHGINADQIETLVNIPKKNAPDLLKLAYCVTVHKSQGSEFDTVIMPIVRSQGIMLQRNLFYTAVTRARSKVWLIGDPQAVQSAVENDRVLQRNTVFGRAVSKAFLGSAGV
jgi:exodeoxyribonuclease V alpha subunit